MILYFLLFLIASFLCFTVPGIFFLKKSKISFSFLEKITLGTIIGFLIFTLISYLLMLLKISLLFLPLIALLVLISLKTVTGLKINFKAYSKGQLFILFLVFVLGITGQMAIIAPSGLMTNEGLTFFSAHGHDGPWHIALMEEMKKGYPLQNPAFAGERLVNYHFFSDIAPSKFSHLFKFSNLDLYFRFFPFLFSLLLGAIAFLLGRKLGNSFSTGVWSVFSVYFVGSFGYLVTWMQDKNIGGESIFWATQIQSSIGNPPQIISNILVLTFIYLLIILISKKNLTLFAISTILVGTLIEFKVYASLVVLLSLAIVGVIQFIKERGIYLLSLFGASCLISAGLYLPNTANSASFLIFEPWWFIRTMIVVDSRLDWIDLELRRQTYISEGNWKRVIQLELTGFLIFFFGNLGIRFVGLIHIVGSIKKMFKDLIFLFLLLISLISLILPLLFLQKGVASNTIQFLQYFLLIFGVFASLSLASIQNRIKNSLLKILFILSIVILSVPTQIGLLYDFYHKPPLSKITSLELEALKFLKKNVSYDSLILTPHFNKNLNLSLPTPPIWAWFDTSYISAFSSGRTYLSDLEQVDIMGYDYKQRLEVQKTIFETDDSNSIQKKLKENNIDFIYFPKVQKPVADFSKFLEKVFDNTEVEIWKVNPLL